MARAKSSHIEALAAALRSAGRSVTVTREPGGTPLAEKLRTLLLANPWMRSPRRCWCLPAGATTRRSSSLRWPGEVVLCDRYTDATFATNGAAGEGFDWDLLSILERMAQTGLALQPDLMREPDLTFWFDLPPATAAQRLATARTPDRFESAGRGLFTRAWPRAMPARPAARSALPAWMRHSPAMRWPNAAGTGAAWLAGTGRHAGAGGRGVSQGSGSTAAPPPWIAAQRAHFAGQRGHAWLLHGPSGLGQFPLALELVRAWLCESPATDGSAWSPAATPSTCTPTPTCACSCPKPRCWPGWLLPERRRPRSTTRAQAQRRDPRGGHARCRGVCPAHQCTRPGQGCAGVPGRADEPLTANALLKTLERSHPVTCVLCWPARRRTSCFHHSQPLPGPCHGLAR